MKRTFLFTVALTAFLSFNLFANTTIWQRIAHEQIIPGGERQLFPETFTAYYLDVSLLKTPLFLLSDKIEGAKEFSLPQPDGTFRAYKIWQTPMMEAPLAEQYPEIKTFTGYAVDDKRVTIKLDFTYKGFHAKVFDGGKTYFIDPYSHANDGFYICYYKKDYLRPEGKYMSCEVVRNHAVVGEEEINVSDPGLKNVLRTNGAVKKTYRLALACTIEYSQAVDGANPTKANVLSAMVTSINRVNGVYERELAVTMALIANNDTLIYLSGTDPYSNSNGGAMLSQNQTNIDNIIGNANYDIGHVFSTGGGGIASLGCVCDNSDKARGVTGSPSPLGDPFDIDYVAHEMGHQFGSDHTFNANTGSCNSNGESSMAYEPGGGSTIMAYAGICGFGDNLQNNSDDYFHAISMVRISNYITTGTGGACPIQTPIANAPPTIPAFSASYTIPYLTPFELTAPSVVDADHETLTYCWEQWNLGNYRSSWSAANLRGPIFRSFEPTASDTRVFVALPKLVSNVTSYIGEKLPQDTRFLTFKLTVRDMIGTLGTFNFPDDTVHLDVINTGIPFAVITPSSAAINWMGGTTETIIWDVASTDVAPINTPFVDIYLSVDGGLTYPFILAANVANDGSEALTIPNVATTNTARVKIKGAGNVFFDISNFDFTITNDPNLPVVTDITMLSWENKITIFPVPAKNDLHIKNDHGRGLLATVFNTVGQQLWSGKVDKDQTIHISGWARGIYYMQLSDTKSNERVVKKFAVE